MAENLLQQPVFGIYLPSDASEGALTLGGIDPVYYTGQLADVPLTSDSYWQVGLDSMHFGPSWATSKSTAAIDSGSSMLAGPSLEVLKIAELAGAMPDPL